MIETLGERRCGPWSTIPRRWRRWQRKSRVKKEEMFRVKKCNCLFDDDLFDDKAMHKKLFMVMQKKHHVMQDQCWMCLKWSLEYVDCLLFLTWFYIWRAARSPIAARLRWNLWLQWDCIYCLCGGGGCNELSLWLFELVEPCGVLPLSGLALSISGSWFLQNKGFHYQTQWNSRLLLP